MAKKKQRRSRRPETARHELNTRTGWRRRIDGIGGLPLVTSVAAAVAVVIVLVVLNRPASDSTGTPYEPIAHANVAGRMQGRSDAPVSIIIFADYQCPYCGDFFDQTEPALRAEFVDSGQATVQFRDYAFLGAESVRAAEAAACAEKQGFFWEYHDILFQKQPSDGRENIGAYSDSRLKQYADEVRAAWEGERSLDTAAFNACVDTRETRAQVEQSNAEARALGVTSTPSFLVDGELMVGAQPIEAFREAVRKAGGG
jgi:protein-disulfide isomerase